MMDKQRKAVVFTLGCKVNGYESGSLENGLAAKGYLVSDELGYADLYIINTCAVTAEAEKKSRQAIARARKFNPEAKIIVTGCASEKSPEDFAKKNGVTLVTGAKAKDKILSMLDEKGTIIDSGADYYEEFLPPKTDRARVYIKVQDGCDNFCSYCIIPYLRGRSRSRRPEKVLEEIRYLDPVEAVITGIDLSAYDKRGDGLTGLMRELSAVDCRIRLGSLEVGVITEEFLQSLKGLKDFAEHFHLSLQSGSDKVLKSMNRHYTSAEFLEKCRLIRRFFPDCAITTDVIAGYATEGEAEFEESLQTVREARFSDVHPFPYSRREGTVGAKLPDLPSKVKDERMDRLIAVKRALKDEFIRNHLGTVHEMIPEETVDGYTVGYTGNYIRCYVPAPYERAKWQVRLVEPYLDGVKAELIKE